MENSDMCPLYHQVITLTSRVHVPQARVFQKPTELKFMFIKNTSSFIRHTHIKIQTFLSLTNNLTINFLYFYNVNFI